MILYTLLQKNPAGSFIGVGSTTSSDGDVNGYRAGTYPAYGGTTVAAMDAYFVAFDEAGDTVFTRTYGTYGQEEAQSVAATLDGGFIFCGNVDSTGDHAHGWNAGYFTDYRGTLRAPDGWIVKLDALGDTVWTVTTGGTGSDLFYKIIATADSGYLAVGHTNSTDISTEHHGNYDLWVVKLDKNGVIEWQKLYGGSNIDNAKDALQLANGSGYALLNSTRSTDGDIEGPKGGGSYDLWLVMIDNEGNLTRSMCYGSTGYDGPGTITEAFEGGLVFSGEVGKADGDVSALHENSNDGWIVKIDTEGAIVWERNIGSNSYDGTGTVIRLLRDGTMVGSIGQQHADVTPSADKTCDATGSGISWMFWLSACPSYTYQDVTICAGENYDFNGTVVSATGVYWDTQSMVSGCDSLIKLILNVDTIAQPTIADAGSMLTTGADYDTYQWLQDGAIISGATTHTYNAIAAGLYSVVVTNANGCSDTSEVFNYTPSSLNEPALFHSMKLYPTPASNMITVELPQLKGTGTIAISSIDGKLLVKDIRVGNTGTQISIAHLPNGVYFIKVTTDEGAAVRKIVKQ